MKNCRIAIFLCLVNDLQTPKQEFSINVHKSQDLSQGGGSDVVSVSCFGVRVMVMFNFMFVHYTFSSVWVAEWPPFGK